jgi:3-phenylpropionate/cinnamic acid dioxygenase small subunit
MPTSADALLTQDREQIMQLLHRYNHAIDGGDSVAFSALFTADAVFAMPNNDIVGNAAITEWAAHVAGTVHVVANPVIDVDGDRAEVRAYFITLKGVTISSTGTYRDDLERTPEGWKFARREVTLRAWA